MKIGFIGIGHMGRHMARRLLDAGYDLAVNDVNREATRPLLERGAKWFDTPKDMAESCEVILASLPGPPEVEAVVYGKNGLMAGWKRGDLFLDTTTNSPTVVRRISQDAAAMGVAVLDAPVFGGVEGAEKGTLTIAVGGDAASLERAQAILKAMGKNVFHMGPVGSGNIAKLVNNLISQATNAVNAEALVLGAKAGADMAKLWQILKLGPANNALLERGYPQSIFRGNFDPGFRLALACKDVGLALALGNELGVPMPLAAVVEQKYLEAKSAGLGEMSSHSLILRLEELTGVKVRFPVI